VVVLDWVEGEKRQTESIRFADKVE